MMTSTATTNGHTNGKAADCMRLLFSGREDHYAVCGADSWTRNPIRGPLTRQSITEQHLSGKQCLGFYVLRTDSTVFASCPDIDNHDDDNPAWREQTAEVYDALVGYGLSPLVELSQSGEGSHVWLFFSDPVSGWLARQFWLAVQSKLTFAFREINPKQDRLTESKPIGNLVRLPLWNKSRFVDVENDWATIETETALDDAMQHRLSEADVRELVFNITGKAAKEPTERPKQHVTSAATSDGSKSAALRAMLRHKAAPKEKDSTKRLVLVCCRAVEHDLSDESTVATVREYEREQPFKSAFSDEDIIRRLRDAEQKAVRGSEITIANFTTIEVDGDDEGEKKTVTVPSSMTEIIDLINSRMGDWPRRVDNMLFVDDPAHGLDYFDRRTTAGLFGWLRRHNKVQWAKGGSLVSQPELFAEIERTTQRYDAIELLPHEPPIGGIYYRGKAPNPGDGKHLRKLVDRFRPGTTVDRDLIQAAFMTPFWGGLPGSRPAFVITSDDGRGVGKTKVAETISHLCGGHLDVSAGEDIETLKTRALAPVARTKRIALIDNIKSMRLSWAELEALITSPVISGRQLYVSEGQRPNILTWFLTLNGVSMATDMAQRSVIIKIVRGENAGPWWEETRKFVDDHRSEIIGDIIGALRSEPFPLSKFSRWATWEKDVLCRLPEPGDAQKLILERQGEADCELDEAEIIEQHFADLLRRLDYDPQTVQVRIQVATAARWYSWAVGEKTKTTSVTRKLKQMADEGHLKRLAAEKGRSYGRCFIWTGPDADVFQGHIANDLQARIGHMMADE